MNLTNETEVCILKRYFTDESFEKLEFYKELKDLNPSCECIECDGYNFECPEYTPACALLTKQQLETFKYLRVLSLMWGFQRHPFTPHTYKMEEEQPIIEQKESIIKKFKDVQKQVIAERMEKRRK